MTELPVLDRSTKPMSPAIRRVIAFILENYAETLPLSGLARLAGLSLSRFMVVFRQQTGLPPHQFICRVRVEAAQRMLEQGQSPLSVAYDAGFFDQSHLTRHFKRHCGVTPGRYMSALREGASP